MKNPSKKTVRRALAVAAMAGGALGLAAAPASALATLTPVVIAPSTSAYSVSGGCTPVLGVTTNLNQLTYAIEGTATATSTNGSVAVSTGVTCVVRMKYSPYTVVGTVSSALPGAGAVAAGLVTVQINEDYVMCWSGTAHYNNNHTETRPQVCG